jgi:2-(1,2-epoxy-1,2-dihydrophenyl)acetyl-CoA isomerase
MSQLLIEDFKDGVLTLTMNRPERLNALNTPLVDALHGALRSAAENVQVRVVQLAGAGKGFSAGGDVGDMSVGADYRVSHEDQVGWLRRGMEISRLLTEMRKPTIARLHGAVAGAGLSIALACDIRIGGESTKMTTAFAKVGLSGDFGGSWYLTQLVGMAKAKELYLLSPLLDAQTAYHHGLITRVVPDSLLEETANEMAIKLADGPTVALGYIKKNVNLAASGASLVDAFDHEAANHIRCASTRDHREAASAFVEKRKTLFQGK